LLRFQQQQRGRAIFADAWEAVRDPNINATWEQQEITRKMMEGNCQEAN